MNKIFLDEGDGGKASGGSAGGKKEKDFTVDIDDRISKLSKVYELTIQRTKTKDTFVDSTPRANKVKNSGAKYCISSHINAGGGTGAEVLISQYTDGKLAIEILKNLEKLGLRNRGAKKRKLNNGQDYYFMRRLTGNVTTLIVEYCFIDTKKDRDFISKSSNRQKCAEAVVKAICKVEGVEYKTSTSSNTKPSTGTSNYKGKRVESIHNGNLRFYSRPSWSDSALAGTMPKWYGFPTIVSKVKVGKSYQYKVKNSKGKTYYVTANSKYVKVK